MIRTLLINVVRGLFLDALAAGASFGILYVAFWLNGDEFTKSFSVYALLAIAAFISTVVIVAIFIAAKVLHWDFIYGKVTVNRNLYWKKRAENKKPLKAWKLRSVLLVNLLFCAVAVVVFVFTRDKLSAKFTESASDEKAMLIFLAMLALLASTAFTQFIYWVSIRSHYKNAKCTSCKNIFCIVDVSVESEKSDTSYKIMNDGRGAYGYYEDREGRRRYVGGKIDSAKATTTKDIWFNCKCLVCGNESLRFESKTSKSWIEGEQV